MKTARKSKFRSLNGILLICAMGCLVCYDLFGGLWLKGLTSAWFVALGCVNLFYGRSLRQRDRRFLQLITLGLAFGMCADVLLGVHFILGILSFALGHVLYLAAFFLLEPLDRRDVCLITPVAVVSLYVVVGTPWIRISDPVLEKMLIGYAVIIACMLGKAFSNRLKKRSFARTLFLVGSLMFWFSDVMLAIDLFGTSSRLTWILCSYTYWPAQNILAHAMYHYVSESEKIE